MFDAEKNPDLAVGDKVVTSGSDNVPVYERGDGVGVVGVIDDFKNNEDYYSLGYWGRMGLTAESFKRRADTEANKHNKLNQTMKSRHLHMIAIGGSIGAGLFVGTGSALRRGGPASLIIDYIIIGVMMFNVVYALPLPDELGRRINLESPLTGLLSVNSLSCIRSLVVSTLWSLALSTLLGALL